MLLKSQDRFSDRSHNVCDKKPNQLVCKNCMKKSWNRLTKRDRDKMISIGKAAAMLFSGKRLFGDEY